MAIGWISKSTQPANRTTFGESPGMSKGVRRYGKDGSKGDFTHASTGGHEVHESEVRPSDPAHSNTERAVVQAQVAGWDPRTGKWLGSRHPNSGKHDGGHVPARVATTDAASGQAYAASGGKFGKPALRPKFQGNTGTSRQDAGALAGNPGDRSRYSGGRGKI